ncbi:MAG: hypothetical protein K9J06_04310 [Flavobacteriales bacterium]|nr:hypothetical protein [Flavobacteriales bacterium]
MKTKNHITEVFRFVSVRPPNLPETVESGNNVIDYGHVHSGVGSAAIAAMEAANGLLLYSQLRDSIGAGGMRPEAVQLAQDFRVTPHFIPDRAALYAAFGGFDHVHAYLNTPAPATTVDEAVTAIEDALGQSISDIVIDADHPEAHLRLWDNLFAQLIAPSDISLREDLVKVVRMVRVLEVLNSVAPSTDLLRDHVNWRAMRTVLPTTVFPVPEVAVPDVSDPAPVPTRPDNTDLFAFSDRVQDAIADMDEVMEQQYAALREEQQRQEPAITSGLEERPALKRSSPSSTVKVPWKLREAFVQQLKADTRNLLTEQAIQLTDLDVPAASKKLGHVLSKRWNKEYRRGQQEAVLLNGAVFFLDNIVCNATMEKDPCGSYNGGPMPRTKGNVQSLYVGDLLLTRRQLIRYQPGEVAHIENVLEGETRNREHTHTRRLEERSTTETERTTFEERDLQTTDRFSLEQASSSVISQQSQMQVGASLTASYGGVVTVGATFGYGTSNSQTNSTQSASSYAQEVTSRALNRVTERVRVERTSIRIEEVVEKNSHGFTNVPTGNGNISGVYTWVDKLYLTRLLNYGKRMMMELHIPEPAAFYLYSMSQAQKGEFEPPMTLENAGIQTFESINEGNYGGFGALYDVADLTPPPPQYTWVNKAFGEDSLGADVASGVYHLTTVENSLAVPKGYLAHDACVKLQGTDGGSLQARVGNHWIGSPGWWYGLDNETETVPFVFMKTRNISAMVTVEVRCIRSQILYDEWRIKTYNSIVQGYRAKLSDYENKVTAAAINSGVDISGNNPGINQAIMREELKRSALEAITGQRFEAFSAMRNNHNPFGYPQFLFAKAEEEGRYASFFEKAVEWDNLTYELYPYFYGRKPGWVDKMKMLGEQADPDFTHFLRAGMAKVLVPVTPAMTASMLHFLDTGNVWAGEDVPLTSDRALRIMDDLGNLEALELEPQPVGDPWVIKMPTSLVTLPTDMEGPNAPYQHLPDYSEERFEDGELDGVDLNA